MTRPAPRTYRCPVSVEQVNPYRYLIRSIPPIHTASVAATWVKTDEGRKLNGWMVKLLTGDTPAYTVPVGLERALVNAADLVGLRAGHEMKNRFRGVQRTAMGQGRCPYLGLVGGGIELCNGAPVPGSVWCELHPDGRKVVDDVSPTSL